MASDGVGPEKPHALNKDSDPLTQGKFLFSCCPLSQGIASGRVTRPSQ